ncbi:MAG: hypothetical protein Q7T26_10495 [Dehalococcoidia bacterium]|nr:hypothetical protein [Dehalococcoidia bacterium]
MTIAEDAFITAARKGATFLGVPDLPFVVIAQSRSWETAEGTKKKVSDALEEAKQKLLSTARPVPA